MNWNATIRQIHRWLSMAFTAGFLINSALIVAAKGGQPPYWVYFLALIPLFLLFATGLYLFALPYVARTRKAP